MAETYALSTDRAAVLAQLVPGTDDAYFWRCLHCQQTGALQEVPALLAAWVEQHGRTSRVVTIENRQALLLADRDPAVAAAFLGERLGIQHDQQRQVPGALPDLPTSLDPEAISLRAFAARARATHPNSFDGFSDRGLEAAMAGGVDDEQLGSLVRRLREADVPGLPALIARWLRLRQGGLESLPVIGQLTRAQLDELLQVAPGVLGDPAFVHSYEGVLRPDGELSLALEPARRAQWLDERWAFVQRLGPAFNAKKSEVLAERLAIDLAAGAPDKQRFLAWLRLPRQHARTNPELLQRADRRGIVADSQHDDALVRACCRWFFEREDSYAEYTEFVREEWLRRLFAETKLLAGQGEMERWYSMLGDPGYYEQLAARVELDFAPTQPQHWRAAAPVTIAVDVKNVQKLFVKVFAIDAWEYLKATGKRIDAAIDLDGVIANDEQVYEYSEPSLRRARRTFDLPTLQGAGTWVVEFVGNGVSSRAVIQKGALTALSRVSAAGHVLTVVDEDGAVVPAVQAFVAGREFAADERGEIVVPFAPEPAERPLVVRAGALASLQSFAHAGEDYSLQAGVFVDEQSLRSGGEAVLLVRPQLQVNGVPVALELLEDAAVEIVATLRDGTTSLQTLRAPVWDDDGELAHSIAVPRDLANLTVRTRGRVQNHSRGRKDDVTALSAGFDVNGIDQSATVEAPLVGRTDAGWFVELRGRNGEPLGGRPVSLSLRHRACTDDFDVTLATGAEGRIELGQLDGIDALRVGGLPDEFARIAVRQPWSWSATALATGGRLTGVVGEVLRIPYAGTARAMGREVATLLALRGGRPVRDASAQVALADGFLELRELTAGSYRLHCREDERTVDVQVIAGKNVGDHVVSAHAAVLQAGRARLHVTDLRSTAAEVSLRVHNAGADARVHVFATHYVPAISPGRAFAWQTAAADDVELARGGNDLVAGRVLSDELRYVLERRYAPRFPGNMLPRPSLLLNPWSPERVLDQASGLGGGAGGRFGGRGGGRGGPGGESKQWGGPAPAGIGPTAWAALDYLAAKSPLRSNLRPDAAGRLVVRRQDLGPGQQLHIVALDADDVVYRTLELPRVEPVRRDRRLPAALPGDAHLSQQQRIDFVAGGGAARIPDTVGSAVQTFATLADVHRLLQARSGSADLAEFAFVLRWPELGDDEKRALYRRYACHELHFFLHEKDPQFFATVLRPYLANKASKQFLDHWLLGDELQGYLEPWEFARLNLFERILLLERLGRGEALQRYVRELGELLPVDLHELQLGFLAALESGGLDAGTKLEDVLRAELRDKEDEPAANAPVPTAAAPGSPVPLPPSEERAGAAERPGAAAADDDALADKKAKDRSDRRRLERERRSDTRAFWRAPEETRPWIEHHWWHRERAQLPGMPAPQQVEDPQLIAANAFWRDYALADRAAPFVSPHFLLAHRSFTEAMLALAVLDLPFAAAAPVIERQGDAIVVKPEAGLLLARSELVAAGAVAGVDPVLIRQECYRLDDRYTFDGNQRRQKPVAKEFLAGVGYGSQVVLTNPTEVPRRLQVLLQVPAGAIALARGQALRSLPVELAAFATATLEFAFYWPMAGDFAHYPAQVSIDGAFVGAAEPSVRHVVATPTTVDTASWEHVSQLAGDAEVLAFLRSQNLNRLDLSRIAWRLRERAFYGEVIALLRARLHFDATVWSFGLLHHDVAAVRDYLAQRADFVALCGPVLESPWLSIDAEHRATYEHTEFEPVHLARVHRVGPWRAIESPDVQRQWQQCVDLLSHRATLRGRDWLDVTYHLLLQGRVEEALAAFARVDRKDVAMQLQYDYLDAYLAMSSGDSPRARQVASAHREHAIERWRVRFGDVLAQLDEIDGAAAVAADPEARDSRQGELAASEPQLEVAVDQGRVVIRHRNVAHCEVSYRPLDVEFAFSNSPFAQQGLAAVAWVKPARTDPVTLATDASQTAVAVPAEFQRGNVAIEVRGGGIVRRTQSLASALAVQTSESYGQLEVRSLASGAPLPKVYVKVYAREQGGGVRFHKDGYTDLRGRFDYASVSTAGADQAERFSLLVLSDTDGAVIREVPAPAR